MGLSFHQTTIEIRISVLKLISRRHFQRHLINSKTQIGNRVHEYKSATFEEIFELFVLFAVRNKFQNDAIS